MYKVSLHKKAAKYYANLDGKTAWRINKAVEEISKDPFDGQHIKRLRGRHSGRYRYSVGDLRVVYRVDIESRIVLIEAIGPRGDVYK
jgi:mRNA interferase RelE/StbE